MNNDKDDKGTKEPTDDGLALADARAWAEELDLGDPEELERIATTMYGCPPGPTGEE